MIKYFLFAILFPFFLSGQSSINKDELSKKNLLLSENDIVISEIMFDPTPRVYLPDAEYLELYNNSDQDVVMDGWKLFVGKKKYSIPTNTLKSGEYLVLTKDVSLFPDINVLQVKITSLSNSGTTLRIETASGDLMNTIAYSSKMFADDAKDNGGWSLELINPKNNCIKKENWTGSVNPNGGTPGKVNSILDLTFFPEVITNITKVVANDDVSSITVTLSNYVDESTLLMKTDYTDNYTLSSENMPDGSSEVAINLNGSIGASENYFVFEGLKSCDGIDVISDTIWASSFQNIERGDILVSEVMFNPKKGTNDFVELYNSSDKYLSLRSASISNFTVEGTTISNENVKKITDENIIFKPHSYIVITNDVDVTITNYNSGHRQLFVEISSMPRLNNTEGNIAVLNPSLEFVDEMAYTDEMFSDKEKKKGGWSLELINTDNKCVKNENWDGSSDVSGATPGLENSIKNTDHYPSVNNMITKVTTNDDESEVNIFYKYFIDETTIQVETDYTASYNYSVSENPNGSTVITINFDSILSDDVNYFLFKDLKNCDGSSVKTDTVWVSKTKEIEPNDLLVNEVMVKPSVDNDQYIEIFNFSDKFFSLKGVVISNYIVEGDKVLSENEKIISEENLILEPHGFIVVTTSTANLMSYFDNDEGRSFVEISTLPKLNTTEGNLALLSSKGLFVDKMFYNSSMYGSNSKADGGVSLELVNPINRCIKTENWSGSNEIKGGTPGKVNSIFDSNYFPTLLNEVVQVVTDDDVSSFVVSFTSYVDETSIEVETNYTDIYNYSLYNKPDGSADISVVLDSELGDDVNYFVFNNLKSCDGSTIVSDTIWLSSFTKIENGDIVINEIMFYPNSNSSEFIEIYNTTDNYFSLKDTYISNYSNDNESSTSSNEELLTSDNIVLNPKSYVVITTDAKSIIDNYKSAPRSSFIEIATMPKLDNSEDNIALLKSNFDFIDKVAYSKDMHINLITSDKQKGLSLERIKASNPSLDFNNWTSASQGSGGATPGLKNSVSPIDVLVEDNLMVYPELFTPNDDGLNDLVELKYVNDVAGSVANVKIFNSQGVFIKEISNNYLMGAEGSFLWDGTRSDGSLCEKGIYVFWIEIFDSNGNVNVYKKICVLG